MKRPARENEGLPRDLEEAVRRAFVAPPAEETERRHLVAIAAAVEEAKRRPAPASPVSRRRTLARLAATGAAAALALPVALAGLAFAGVSLPDAADTAFESVGIDLPNQAADDEANGPEGTADGRERAGAEGKEGGEEAGDAGSAEDGDSRPQGDEGGNGGESKSEADPNGPPEHANGPPDHATDGSTGAPPHSQQGGGGPPSHATDGSTGPPPQSQGDASGQSSAPAPAPSPGDSGQAQTAPHGTPPLAGPVKPSQSVPAPLLP